MNARYVVLAAAVGMALVEIIATVAESPYAVILAALFLVGAAWLWMRPDSVWPTSLLAVLFAFEIIYLGDYDWNESAVAIATTIVVCAIGLLGAATWFVQRMRGGSSSRA